MATDSFNNPVYISNLTLGQVSLPAGSVSNVHVAAGSAGNFFAATKLEGQFALPYRQATGTAVVAETAWDLHVVRGLTGEVVGLRAAITGAIATGADRTVTIDLQKSTGAGAFATVLTTTIQFGNTDVLRTAKAAVLNASLIDLVAGDLLRLTVAVAGAAGNQAQGLVVTLTLREDPI